MLRPYVEILASFRIPPDPVSLLQFLVARKPWMNREAADLGVRVSVDDFGTGYSCLNLLHQFPIDTLKIDRSFVGRLGSGGQGDETVRAIIALAGSLGMEVVAEGVESVEQLACLAGLGCEYAQGHLFSPAVAAAEAQQLLATPRRWSPSWKRPADPVQSRGSD